MREPVYWFAEQMELKLQKHDKDRGDRGWKYSGAQWLLRRLYQEVRELHRCVDDTEKGMDELIQEAVDVANFAMMIADSARYWLESKKQ